MNESEEILPYDVICGGNDTNSTWPLADCSLAPLHHLVAGCVVFVVVLPFALFNIRWLPLGTTAALLIGALLMLFCQVISQEEVYEIISRHDYTSAILILLGMTFLAQYFEREQFLTRILRKSLNPLHTFENVIWKVCLLSFIISALFTSDISCAIITPLFLKFWEVQERPRSELETFVIGIATSANIGSVVTINGNIQMALIAGKTSYSPYLTSKLDLRYTLLYLGPPALLVFFINLAFLIAHHRLKTGRIEKNKLISEASASSQEMAGLTNHGLKCKPDITVAQANGVLKYDRDDFLYEGVSTIKDERIIMPCQLETIPEDEVLEIESASPSLQEMDVNSNCTDGDRDLESNGNHCDTDCDEEGNRGNNTSENLSSLTLDYKPSALTLQALNQANNKDFSSNNPLEIHGLRLTEGGSLYRALTGISIVEFLPGDSELPIRHSVSNENVFATGDSTLFQVALVLLTVMVYILLLSSTSQVAFNIGLVPVAACILTMFFDALLNRQNAIIVLHRVRWSVVAMLVALFIWIQGFHKTGVSRYVWHKLGFDMVEGSLDILHIAVLSVTVLVGSNIIGGVPVTLIILEHLLPCMHQRHLLLYLAWCTSVGGNFTLFGSTANLIVVHATQRTLKFRLSFWSFLKFGFLTSIVTVSVGIVFIYGLLLI